VLWPAFTSTIWVENSRRCHGPIRVKPKEWLEAKGNEWRDNVKWATLDLSGPYRAVFNEKLPGATQVADPLHVVKLISRVCYQGGWWFPLRL
jgi:transposase